MMLKSKRSSFEKVDVVDRNDETAYLFRESSQFPSLHGKTNIESMSSGRKAPLSKLSGNTIFARMSRGKHNSFKDASTSVYQDPRSIITKSESDLSDQNTLLTQHSNSTVASSIGESLVSSNCEIPRHNITNNDGVHKIGNHFTQKGGSTYSVQSYQKVALKNVSMSNVVLINNLPYPVQIEFPARISKRSRYEAQEVNFDQSNTSTNTIKYTTTDTPIPDVQGYHDYDPLIQLIDTYNQ